MGIDQVSSDRDVPPINASGMKFAVACGRFNDEITQRLLAGVESSFASMGGLATDLSIEWVPGAFEVPFALSAMLESGRFDAAIGLGCVIRGETSHYDFVAGECARGLQDLALQAHYPVIFGVLTTENRQQALDRSQTDGGHNVGAEGAATAAEMVELQRRYRS